MKNWRRYLLVFLIGTMALGLSPAAGFGQTGGFDHLDPGGRADLDEKVPVQFVFVGYDEDDVNARKFLAGLPREYKPIVRSRYFYNESVERSLLGLNYTYDYDVRFADAAYERRLFGYLSSIARRAPLTDFQKLYNGNDRRFCAPPPGGQPPPCQKRGVRDVSNNNHIDAPSVEKWLARNAPEGVDTRRNTVFFINWWGDGVKPRAGFKHHVYTKTDEPDPDTGYNFGVERDSRKIIAWGGTTAGDEETGLGSTNRIWFHDLSAGPESFTDNWNVDDPDLTGDGVPDDRLPPIWEYNTPGGFKPKPALTGDLSRLSRYVAINLLFTSSPLYPPQFTPQLLPDRINLDTNTVEGIGGVNSSERYQSPDFIRDEIAELHRLPYSLDQQDIAYRDKARECYREFVRFEYTGRGRVCYDRYRNYTASANLFLYGANNLDGLLDGGRPREYEAAMLNWAVEDGANGETTPPSLGFADDNYRNGTQSFVFSFVSPQISERGYGLSTTEVHEYGHHLNTSHPFDGFDYETRTDYEPDGPYYLSLAGNENNTIMSYVDLNWDFSQFDRDNTNRFQAAGYINVANALARRVLNSPRSARAQQELREADEYYGRAKGALARHEYAAAFDNARLAYERVLSGARDAGVDVEASDDGRTATPNLRASSQIPGAYIDKPELREPEASPAEQRTAESIETRQPEEFTPAAHRQRQ